MERGPLTTRRQLTPRVGRVPVGDWMTYHSVNQPSSTPRVPYTSSPPLHPLFRFVFETSTWPKGRSPEIADTAQAKIIPSPHLGWSICRAPQHPGCLSSKVKDANTRRLPLQEQVLLMGERRQRGRSRSLYPWFHCLHTIQNRRDVHRAEIGHAVCLPRLPQTGAGGESTSSGHISFCFFWVCWTRKDSRNWCAWTVIDSLYIVTKLILILYLEHRYRCQSHRRLEPYMSDNRAVSIDTATELKNANYSMIGIQRWEWDSPHRLPSSKPT